MKAYGHLTYEEREHIALLCAEGPCPSKIAQKIGRPACTVGRELKRNSNGDGDGGSGFMAEFGTACQEFSIHSSF